MVAFTSFHSTALLHQTRGMGEEKEKKMRIPGFGKKKIEEPAVVVTPLQELLKAENEVQLAEGRIDDLNREIWDWQRHWGMIWLNRGSSKRWTLNALQPLQDDL